MLNSGHVAVVGSANLDVVMALERFPQAGETVIGARLEEVGGGKGANQAVAAARCTTTTFIGCIGQDEAGTLLMRGLQRAGVHTEYVMRCSEPTGRAFIQVTPDGENSIVVMALANSSLETDAVLAALDALRPAVVLTQLEIPLETVDGAARWAERNGATFVLNPSPFTAMPRSLLECCDPLIVNAAEAEAVLHSTGLLQHRVATGASVGELAVLVAGLARSVVVTDGSRGAHVGTSRNGVSSIDGERVVAVDATGAGDELAGTLAAGLALGLGLQRSAELANEAAARLVQIPRSQR